MKQLTKKEQEIIKNNLNAFLYYFKPIKIEKDNDGYFYIYQEGRDEYIQRCYNIHYVNGWLYGAVQRECKVIGTLEQTK